MYQLLLLLIIISHISYLKLYFNCEKNFLFLFWVKYESLSDQKKGRSERIMLIFDKQCIIELSCKKHSGNNCVNDLHFKGSAFYRFWFGYLC